MLVAALLNAIFQVLLSGLIPLLWWLFSARHEQPLLAWLGLKPVRLHHPRHFWTTLALTVLVALPSGGLGLWLLRDAPQSSAFSAFQGRGWPALPLALLYAFVQTGFAEEVFFRGFLGKRLISRFGFMTGNTSQAALFGGMHGLMVYAAMGLPGAVLVALSISALAWLMGDLNERRAGGSILPGWAVHGTSNLLMALVVMFRPA